MKFPRSPASSCPSQSALDSFNASRPMEVVDSASSDANSSSPVLKILAAVHAMDKPISSSSPGGCSPVSSVTSNNAGSTSPDLVKQEQLLKASIISAVTAAQQKKKQLLTSSSCSSPPCSPQELVLPVTWCKDPLLKKLAQDEINENTTSSSLNSYGDRRLRNNNTSSYGSRRGMLRIFKDYVCLVEFIHEKNEENGNKWIAIKKEIEVPLEHPGTMASSNSTQRVTKSEGSASAHSASDSASIADGSSSPSPWQPRSVLGGHRAKSSVRRLNLMPEEIRCELNFSMRPHPCITVLRKKVRGLKRKRRRPYDSIVVGALLMKMEAQAVTSRPKRRDVDMDRIKKSSRLEKFVTKVQNLPPKKKKNFNPLVQIQTWQGSKGTKVSGNKANFPWIPSSKPLATGLTTTRGGVTRVKSKLFMVEEACTTATMPNTSPYPNKSHQQKVKVEAKNVGDGSKSNGNSLNISKGLPITPTLARIKSETNGSTPLLTSSLISPDLQRVKVEIESANRSLTLSSSPGGLDSRDPHFLSPRKRILHQIGVDNGSPLAKKHRLSTDSRGSVGSSDGGTSSPHLRTKCQSPRTSNASSPFSLATAAAASPPKVGRSSSFSIDSIISRDEKSGQIGLVRPVALPASPVRIGSGYSGQHVDTPDVKLIPIRSPTPRSRVSPPNVPISPYTARSGLDANRMLDPRLAHLAGVAADPRLGLTPTAQFGFSYNNPSVMNSYFPPGLLTSNVAASSQLGLSSGLWMPPVSRAIPLAPKRPSSPKIMCPSSELQSRQSSLAAPIFSAASASPLLGGWPPQYRGEPKVATPTMTSRESASPDAPLNLSTKK